jgi:PPOX class probable F420-dependent enzyme
VSEDLEQLRRVFRDLPACRVATVRPDGGPHVATRWFVWPDDAVWVATRVGDTTWSNATRDPRASIVVDRGRDWTELEGVRVEGVAELLPAEHPDMRVTMSAWLEKYRSALGGAGFERFAEAVPRLGFLRITPSRVDAWHHA